MGAPDFLKKLTLKRNKPIVPQLKVISKIDSHTFLDVIEPYIISMIFTIGLILMIQTFGSGYIKSMTTGGKTFPFTFQGLMWVVMGIGIGNIHFKYLNIKRKMETYHIDCFPRDPSAIYSSKEIASILLRLKQYTRDPDSVFPRLVVKVLRTYQSNKTVDEAVSMLQSQIDIMGQKSDTDYNRLRYYSWLLPSLGFMGTVYGISEAVAVVGQSSPDDPELLKSVALSLAVAFDTTLLSLVQSSFLLYFMNVLESREERLNVAIEERVVDEVITRLK